MANFLGELEASGLLEDSASEGGPSIPPDSSAGPAPDASAATGAGETANAHQGNGQTRALAQEGGEAPAAAEADPGPTGPAEQRVLGPLDGGNEQWFEVLDTASGKVYFWSAASNQVVWDAPEGTKPRSAEAVHGGDRAPAEAADSNADVPNSMADSSAQQEVGPQPAADAHQGGQQALGTGDAGPDGIGPGHGQGAQQAVAPHQLELLTLLLEQEAAAHHPAAIPALQRLSVQAAALRDAHAAILAMAESEEGSDGRLLLPRAAFNAWVHQQFNALQAEADDASIQAPADQGAQPPPAAPPAVGPATLVTLSQQAASSLEVSEEGELPPGEPSEDMEIDAVEPAPVAQSLHMPASQARPGSGEASPPLPDEEEEDSPQPHPDRDADPPLPVDQEAASLPPAASQDTPENGEPSGLLTASAAPAVKRLEYAAQPVRSATPPDADGSAASTQLARQVCKSWMITPAFSALHHSSPAHAASPIKACRQVNPCARLLVLVILVLHQLALQPCTQCWIREFLCLLLC